MSGVLDTDIGGRRAVTFTLEVPLHERRSDLRQAHFPLQSRHFPTFSAPTRRTILHDQGLGADAITYLTDSSPHSRIVAGRGTNSRHHHLYGGPGDNDNMSRALVGQLRRATCSCLRHTRAHHTAIH